MMRPLKSPKWGILLFFIKIQLSLAAIFSKSTLEKSFGPMPPPGVEAPIGGNHADAEPDSGRVLR